MKSVKHKSGISTLVQNESFCHSFNSKIITIQSMQATQKSTYVWAEGSDGWSTHLGVPELDTETGKYETVLTACRKPAYVWIKNSEGLWIRTHGSADRVVPAKNNIIFRMQFGNISLE